MSELDDSFAKLLGKQPSDKERQDLYRVRDALGLNSNDALWLILMALQHYETQYEQIPKQIVAAATETLQTFQHAANATASAAAENARHELASAVALASRDVARQVASTQRLKWLCATVVACVVTIGGLGWFMNTKGREAGYSLGYGLGFEAAKDQKAAASWATSPEGRAAYRLAQNGELLYLARCSLPGWYVKDGVCFPAPSKHGLYGWRIDAR